MLNEKLVKKQILICVKGAAQNIFIQQRKPSTQSCQIQQHNFKITRGWFLNPHDSWIPAIPESPRFNSARIRCLFSVVYTQKVDHLDQDSGTLPNWFLNPLGVIQESLGSDSWIPWRVIQESLRNHLWVILESLGSDSGIPSKWFRNHLGSDFFKHNFCVKPRDLSNCRNQESLGSDLGIIPRWFRINLGMIQESLGSDSGITVMWFRNPIQVIQESLKSDSRIVIPKSLKSDSWITFVIQESLGSDPKWFRNYSQVIQEHW